MKQEGEWGLLMQPVIKLSITDFGYHLMHSVGRGRFAKSKVTVPKRRESLSVRLSVWLGAVWNE